jgi:CDP-glycerol glycerophosphotransferase (TagB/SpsB family)
MKTDRLFDPDWIRATQLERYGFGGDRPVLLYAPTGAKMNSLEIMGEDAIDRIIRCGQFDLIVKPHDHPKNKTIDWFGRLSRFEGAHCRVTSELDVIPLLRLADLLITDASSVASEYALLDRPIVFLDTPKLIERALAAKDSALDLHTWGREGGLVSRGPGDVVTTIERSLAGPDERAQVRQAMANDLFYNPGTATDAAMDWVERTLLGRTAFQPLLADVASASR